MFMNADMELEATEWLHSDAALLAQCKDFDEYCDRKRDQGDPLADIYREITWLGTQFPYAQRYPDRPLPKSLKFPAIDKMADLFTEYYWLDYDKRQTSTIPEGTLRVSTFYAPTLGNKKHLFVKPTEAVQAYMDQRWEPEASNLNIIEHRDAVLVTWSSNIIASTHWLAYMEIDQLKTIPSCK
jgi:hypothetical protein